MLRICIVLLHFLFPYQNRGSRNGLVLRWHFTTFLLTHCAKLPSRQNTCHSDLNERFCSFSTKHAVELVKPKRKFMKIPSSHLTFRLLAIIRAEAIFLREIISYMIAAKWNFRTVFSERCTILDTCRLERASWIMLLMRLKVHVIL